MDFGAILQSNLDLLFIGVGLVALFYTLIYPFLKMGYAFVKEVG
jgi:hypothetical protein